MYEGDDEAAAGGRRLPVVGGLATDADQPDDSLIQWLAEQEPELAGLRARMAKANVTGMGVANNSSQDADGQGEPRDGPQGRVDPGVQPLEWQVAPSLGALTDEVGSGPLDRLLDGRPPGPQTIAPGGPADDRITLRDIMVRGNLSSLIQDNGQAIRAGFNTTFRMPKDFLSTD